MMKTIAKSKRAERRATDAQRSTTSMNPMGAEGTAASERVMKKVLSSKQSSIAFLVKVGILDKSGKGLAKPYR